MNESDQQKALKLVEDDKIALIDDENLKDFYVVTGYYDDYLVVLPDFCTCDHFIHNCVREPGKVCKHILAVRMVEGKITRISMEDWTELLFREH